MTRHACQLISWSGSNFCQMYVELICHGLATLKGFVCRSVTPLVHWSVDQAAAIESDVCVCVWGGVHVFRGLPTHPRRFCNPAILYLSYHRFWVAAYPAR